MAVLEIGDQPRRAVGGSIIENDEFDTVAGNLRKNGFEASGDEILNVERRNENAQPWLPIVHS